MNDLSGPAKLSLALIESVIDGDTDESIRLLSEGADSNAIDEAGKSVLCRAIENGNTRLCKKLLEHGANISTKDHKKSAIESLRSWGSLLKSAFSNGSQHEDTASSLASSISNYPPGGNAIFSLTQYDGEGETMMLDLLNHGIDLGDPYDTDSWYILVWGWAVSRGYIRVAEILATRGVPIDVPATFDFRDVLKCQDNDHVVRLNPAIFSAIEGGHSRLVRFLLENGADPMQVAPSDGEPVLVWATRNISSSKASSYLEIVAALVEYGADPCKHIGRSPLSYAMAGGSGISDELADLLLAAGASETIASKDELGWNVLHYISAYRTASADRKRPNIIEKLIKAGANINAFDNLGHTPLWQVASRGYPFCAAEMLEMGAEVDQREPSTSTPLMEACKHNVLEFVEILLRSGADANAFTEHDTPLLLALNCPVDTLEKINSLLAAGAQVVPSEGCQTQPLFRCADEISYPNGYLPILLAAAREQQTLSQPILDEILRLLAVRPGIPPVRLLLPDFNGNKAPYLSGSLDVDDVLVVLEAGARANHTFDRGNTILHALSARGFDDNTDMNPIVRRVLQCGAAIDVQNDENLSPIQLAVMKGNHRTFAALIQHGSSVSQVTKKGETLLHLATQAKAREYTGHTVLDELESHAKHPHLQDVRGRTLANAITSSRYSEVRRSLAEEDIIIDLVNHPLDALTKDKEGLTPLHHACKMANPITVSGLLFGADFRAKQWQLDIEGVLMAKDDMGRLPMHWAAQSGNTEVVTLLLHVPEEYQWIIGAQVNMVDEDSYLPFTLAKKAGFEDAAELLRNLTDIDNEMSTTALTAREQNSTSALNSQEVHLTGGNTDGSLVMNINIIFVSALILLIIGMLVQLFVRTG